jgi:hypothetical protein
MSHRGSRHLDKETQPTEKGPAPAKLRYRSGLIAEAMLTTDRSEIRIAAGAKQIDASPALISRVFQRLTGLQILEEHGAGPNRS